MRSFGFICCQRQLIAMAAEAHAYNITLLFEPIIEAYLAHSSLEATAIHGITCCYGHPVTMAIEACAYNIAVGMSRDFKFGI